MKTKKLYMVREEEDGAEWLVSDGAEWLVSANDPYNKCRPAEPHEVTLEAMADMLDQDAEGANAHEFNLLHRAVAALLYREVGREVTTRIMRRLVDFEGLQGIVGVCGCGPPEKGVAKELGVNMTGSDWRLPE